MRDFYFWAPDRAALAADLSVLGLADGGELYEASEDHALRYIGDVIETPAVLGESGQVIWPATWHAGVYAALRCLSTELAGLVGEAVFYNGTIQTDAPAGAPVWL